MTTTVLAPYLKQRFFDNNGNPAVGGTVNTLAAGTNTPIATYKDSVGTLNSNPITLNGRGECDLWLLPNVAYKFVVADALGNPIFTEDNVTQSQLITLYGGGDTGAVNAYVLTFVANFTSYTDGIVVIWIPSHTNTGASTININGLGVINITNGDGSALSAGELTANIPAQILLKGGAAILLNPFATFQTGNFTLTYVGGTTSPSGPCFYSRVGNQIMLVLQGFAATSNSTSFQLNGIPPTLQPPSLTQVGSLAYATNNGATVTGVQYSIIPGSANITFLLNGVAAGWNPAGTKAVPNAILSYLYQ